MKLIDALKEICKKYSIKENSEEIYEIQTNKLLTATNGMYVVLKAENSNAVLSDFGSVCDVFENAELENLKDILKEYGVVFDNYHLIKKYSNIDDVKSFIDCLDKISIKFAK